MISDTHGYPSPPHNSHTAELSYCYTRDLWDLHQQPNPKYGPNKISPATMPSPSPLKSEIWEAALRKHPDRWFTEYVVQGLEYGFKLGFNGTHPVRSSGRNMSSAYETPHVVSSYLEAECELGRVIGPLPQPPSNLIISKLGVIPKKTPSGKMETDIGPVFPGRLQRE